ncbi:unnamed protein product [Oppiella nova]|uniref:Uncharacterized protein n=1 Tax=Oppiella nova TaxID=334625 RepID=A0A7R9M6K6_9ACAR|nr:unnamed protein product [Oppiella nova]CAG2170415.1 unnamed protein product [Oppiella nova]
MRSMIAVLTLLFVVFTIGDFKNVNQRYAKTIPKVADSFKTTFVNEFKQGHNVSTYPDNSDKVCWVCSRPCAMIYCCEGSNPQCCSVGGYCGCCTN